MIKKIIFLTLTTMSFAAICGLPPTTSKLSGDATKKTTFNYEFPNFTGTHNGSTVTLDVLGVAGGGTGSTTQNFVDLLTAQSIDGVKTFTSAISGSVTGNAATVTNGVYTTNKLSALSATTSAELAGVISDETGTGNLVYSDNPTFTNLNIGTASGNITGNSATVTDGVYTSNKLSVLSATTSAELAGVISDETGTGNLVFSDSPVFTTPNIGTASGNITGNAATVTTNANLSGPIASTGNVSYIASQTGTGSKFVVDTSPTLVTPNIGVASGDSLAVGGALNANMILDITTTAKASRPTPLMTTTQRNALTGVEGGMVFDSTLHLPYYYNGSSWQTTTGLPTYIPVVPGVSSGNIDTFSFSYGTTNSTTNCSASPCSYLDQIGTGLTSLTTSGTGTYTMNLSRTYTKLKCAGGCGQSGVDQCVISNVPILSCSSCSTLTFTTSARGSGAAVNSVGTISCQGSY